MTATLPSELRDVFERASTAELVIIDEAGRPHAHRVSPSYHQGGVCIDLEPGRQLGDHRVAVLFGTTEPIVLVQGTASAEGALHVRPERVFAWPADDPDAEPRLYDAHLEEVRSGHNEEPEVEHAEPEGGGAVWDERLETIDAALVACVAPDGFPFAARVAVEADAGAGVLRFAAVPVGLPVEPGPACLRAEGHARVEGDLVAFADDGWGLVPHRVLSD